MLFPRLSALIVGVMMIGCIDGDYYMTNLYRTCTEGGCVWIPCDDECPLGCDHVNSKMTTTSALCAGRNINLCCKANVNDCSWNGHWVEASTLMNYYCIHHMSKDDTCGSLYCTTNSISDLNEASGHITGDHCNEVTLLKWSRHGEGAQGVNIVGRATCGFIGWYNATRSPLERVDVWYKSI